MAKRIIQQGAEAIIYLKDNQIIKNRVKKGYRLQILDEKLRKRRTKSESKIIEKLSKTINVPKIISVTDNEITMEYINGKKLSDHLEELDYNFVPGNSRLPMFQKVSIGLSEHRSVNTFETATDVSRFNSLNSILGKTLM